MKEFIATLERGIDFQPETSAPDTESFPSDKEIARAIARVVNAARLRGSEADQNKLDDAIRPLVGMIKRNQI